MNATGLPPERPQWEARVKAAEEQLAAVRPQLENAQAERDALRAERDRLKRELELIQGSRSWNLTRPLRTVRRRYDVLRTSFPGPGTASN